MGKVSEFRIRLKFSLRQVRPIASSEAIPPLRNRPVPSKIAPPPIPPQPPQGATPPEQWQLDLGEQLRKERQFIESTLAKMAQTVQQLQTEHTQRLHEMRQLAAALAINCATQLLHREIAAGEFPLEEMIRDMTAGMDDPRAIEIHLHPEDLRLLQRRLEGRPLFSDLETPPKFVTNPRMSRGECMVDGGSGMLFAGWRDKLAEMQEDLLRRMGHAGT